MRLLLRYLQEALSEARKASWRIEPDTFERTWNLAAQEGLGMDAIAQKLGVTRVQLNNQRIAMMRVRNADGTPKYILEPLGRGARPRQADPTTTPIGQKEFIRVARELKSVEKVASHFGINYEKARQLMRTMAPDAMLSRGAQKKHFDQELMIKLWNASDDINEFMDFAATELGHVVQRKEGESDESYRKREAQRWQHIAFMMKQARGTDPASGGLKKLRSIGPHLNRVRVQKEPEYDDAGNDMPEPDIFDDDEDEELPGEPSDGGDFGAI